MIRGTGEWIDGDRLEAANESWYSVGTIAGAISAGVTAGVGTALGSMDASDSKFLSGAVKLGTAAAGKTAEYATYAAYSLAEGGTLLDAYDNMGGLTINVANLGSILDLAGSVLARENKGGQSIFGDGKVLQKLSGIGLLEVNFGSDGVSTAIGMGGIDVGGAVYEQIKRGIDYAGLKRDLNTAEGRIAYGLYVNGDWTMENTAMRIANGKDDLKLVEKGGLGSESRYGHTVQNDGGRTITIADMGYADNVAALGHEAYRDGLTPDENYLETRESVRAHTELAARMRAEGANFSGSFVGQDLAVYDYARSVGDMSIMAKYADDFYDSSGDYLTLVRDGYNFFLEYDGLADIYDEDGQFLVGAGTGRYDIQTALSKYLNVSMSDAAKILEEAGFETNGDSWITDKNNGKRLAINSPTDADADSYIYAANYIQNIKGAIAAVLFEKGGDVAAARNALLLETLNSGDDRYIDLRNLAIDIFLPNYRMFGDVVNSLSTDANDPNYPSGSIHKGNDYAVARGTVFNTIFSGIVKEISTPNSIVFDTLEAFNASRNLQTPESDHKWYYTHHDERKDAAGNTLYLKDQNVRGNGVIIEHGFIFEGNFISMGFFTRSNHFDSVSVTLGQYVTGGTGIGLAGNSGWSTGSHVDHNTYFKANTKNFIQDLYELDTSVENWDGDRYVNPKNLYDLFK